MANETQQNNATLAEEEDLEAQLAYENLKRRREARRRKRIITIVIIAAIALVGVIWFVAGQANSDQDSDAMSNEPLTATVYVGDFSTTVTANGATEPVESTVVSPEVEGIIENMSLEEGQHVNEGDVLFTLKNDDLDKEVREAESGVKKAQTALDAAYRAADKANRAVDDAYDSYNNAVDQANDSEEGDAMFDEATLRSGIDSAEEAYQTALDGISSAKDDLADAQTKLEETKAKADKRTVKAPVSGSIVTLNAVNGQNTASGAGGNGSGSSSGGALVTISDLSQMKVTVQVNEVDIAHIKEGQKATATFSALPDVSLDAKVQRIASSATGSGSSDGGSGGVVTYAVDLIIPDPDPNLKPGMTATVSITTQYVPQTLIVPVAALQGSEGEQYVSVLVGESSEDGAPSEPSEGQEAGGEAQADASAQTRDVPVKVIEKNTSEAAVEGNIKDGDAVVLDGGAGDGGMDGMSDTDATLAVAVG